MHKLHKQQERVDKLEQELRKKARKLDLANQELEETLAKRTEALQEVEAQKAYWEKTFREHEADMAEKTKWRNEEIKNLLDEKKALKESEEKALAEATRLTEENLVWRDKAEGLDRVRKANEEEIEKLKRAFEETKRNFKILQEDEGGWREKNKGLEKELAERGDEVFELKKSKKELEQLLEEETRKLKKKTGSQEKELAEIKSEMEKDKDIIKELRTEIESLKKSEGSLQNEITRLERILAGKEEELKAEKEEGSRKGTTFEKDLLQRNEEIEKHKNIIKGLRSDLEDCATNEKKYQNEITRLKETIIEKDEELKIQNQGGIDKANLLESEIATFKADIEKQRGVIRDLKGQVEEGLKRERMMKTENEKSEKESSEREKELKLEVEAGLIREKALQAEIAQLQKAMEEKDLKLKEMDELKNQLAEVTEAYEQQETILAEKEREIASSRGVARNIAEQKERLEASVEELRNKLARITGKRSVLAPAPDSYSKEKMARLRELEAMVKDNDNRFERAEMKSRELKNLLRDKETIIAEKDFYIKSLEEKLQTGVSMEQEPPIGVGMGRGKGIRPVGYGVEDERNMGRGMGFRAAGGVRGGIEGETGVGLGIGRAKGAGFRTERPMESEIGGIGIGMGMGKSTVMRSGSVGTGIRAGGVGMGLGGVRRNQPPVGIKRKEGYGYALNPGAGLSKSKVLRPDMNYDEYEYGYDY